ncbi:PEP-CTERM sorting domain-containing protein [Allocoleopsis sp.]|uniref:PEP-CTERM sorting domain-containing protein n=1 Tax=Allocoleopsis sp. TaxID=3088169 RepID=UPI0032C21010
MAFTVEPAPGHPGSFTSILTSDGTTTTTIADTSGSFRSLLTPSINDKNTVAFFAELNSGERGIFPWSDSVVDRVIAIGDPLFGSVVEYLGFSRAGLNNSGQIAFSATLTDGTQGIYLATPVSEPDPLPTPVPEPTSTLGILTFGVLGVGYRRSRKQKRQL